MQFTITLNGESVTLQGVTDGATIDLTPQSLPTVPTVPTVPEPTAAPMVDEVDEGDATEPTPPTTVGPKGVNRSERKRTQRPPQSKAAVRKGKGADPVKRKGEPSAAQRAGWAKTRHGKHASVTTATEWLALCNATEDADRIKSCKAQLKADGFRISKAGKVSKA